jgi:hypothetical protein
MVMVRPMLERTKRTIRAEDVQSVKELRKLGPLLSGLRTVGTERDRAGNRKRVHGSVLRADSACALQPCWMGRSSRRSGGWRSHGLMGCAGFGLPVATGLQACRSTELALCRSMGGLGALRPDRLKPVLRTASQPIAPREAVRNPESRRCRSGLLGQREPRAEQDCHPGFGSLGCARTMFRAHSLRHPWLRWSHTPSQRQG